jgi:ribosomal-protein-serine acetyltransferase
VARGTASLNARRLVMFTYSLDERTHLRLLEESDAEELYAVVAANRDYLANWMPWAAKQTLDDTLEFIRSSRKNFAENNGFQVAIVENERIVGGVGFDRPDWANLSMSIGYWIAEAAQGRGIVTRAVGALVDHGFRAWKLNRIEIRAAVDNQRSRAIPRRLGFEEEGVLRQAERVGDRFVDHVVYAMLAADWSRRASRDASDAPPQPSARWF